MSMDKTSQCIAIARWASLNAGALRYWYRYYWNLTSLLLGRHIAAAWFFWALRVRRVELVARTGGGMYLVCPDAERIAFGKKEWSR
jgi:hypothetical protein